MILLPFTRPRESWWSGLLPGACNVLLLLFMLHIQALMLPPESCGGMNCLVDSQGSRMLCCLRMLMPAWVRLCLSLSEAVACASMGTSVVLCSIAPWLSLACVFLSRSGPLTLRPLPGLRMVGRLTTSTMLLCLAPGTAAPGSVVVTVLPLGRLAALPLVH